jgi:glyoxylase-like metal-dependent hydrolase (beta-lactamase superfamily II)
MKSIINRRNLIKNIACGSSALALGSALPQVALSQASAQLNTFALNDTVSLISGAGSNVLVKQAANGELLVIDGGLEQNASALLNAIEAATGRSEITTLANTHWHREQTGLNQIVGEAGGRIFSHENTRLWLGVEIERPWENFVFEPLPEIAQPNETFYHYGDLDHAGSVVEYGYLLQAHTDGDMYMYLPEDNILHAGGVVSNDVWPLLDWWTGGWSGGLVDGLEVLIEVADDDTVIVPAHGPVMTKAELITMRDMYSTVYNNIRTLFMGAQGPQETLAAKPTAEFDGRWGNSDQFVLLSHQSVLAHFAPDA